MLNNTPIAFFTKVVVQLHCDCNTSVLAASTTYADNKLAPPDYRLALKWAYVSDNKYLISTYEKQLAFDEQAEARRLADEWKAARRPKDSK